MLADHLLANLPCGHTWSCCPTQHQLATKTFCWSLSICLPKPQLIPEHTTIYKHKTSWTGGDPNLFPAISSLPSPVARDLNPSKPCRISLNPQYFYDQALDICSYMHCCFDLLLCLRQCCCISLSCHLQSTVQPLVRQHKVVHLACCF